MELPLFGGFSFLGKIPFFCKFLLVLSELIWAWFGVSCMDLYSFSLDVGYHWTCRILSGSTRSGAEIVRRVLDAVRMGESMRCLLVSIYDNDK